MSGAAPITQTSCPLVQSISPQIDNFGIELQDKILFSACYPNLNPSIAESELRTVFSAAIRDPFLRMKNPEIFCADRAYLLVEHLAKLGFRTRLLGITASPSVVGVVNDAQGKPTQYWDFHGPHWVVAVDVRETNGALVPKILDPQFYDVPMNPTDYFLSTTGQPCEKAVATRWSCSYQETSIDAFPGNVGVAGDGPKSDGLTSSISGCNFPRSASIRANIAAVNQWTQGTYLPIPEELKRNPKMRQLLILKGFNERKTELDEEIIGLQSMLQKLDSQPEVNLGSKGKLLHGPMGDLFVSNEDIAKDRQRLVQMETDQKMFPTKLAEIRKNLGL